MSTRLNVRTSLWSYVCIDKYLFESGSKLLLELIWTSEWMMKWMCEYIFNNLSLKK